jgi:hypothetical protein
MAKKRTSERKPQPAKKRRRKQVEAGSYKVTLTPGQGNSLVATVHDNILYPLALSWNRVLSADGGRGGDAAGLWRTTGHLAIVGLAAKGMIARDKVDPFINDAAASGIVQIEIEWRGEEVGWAARVFPWEHLLSLATRAKRNEIKQSDFVVVRVLRSGRNGAVATGPASFASCDPGPDDPPLDFEGERLAIEASLDLALHPLRTGSVDELRADVASVKPRIIHFAASDHGPGPLVPAMTGAKPTVQKCELLADITASQHPELAVYSTCFSGRRLAPLAVAAGAHHAVGFHGAVMDASIPLFFGAFYRVWKQGRDALASVKAGLLAHNSQRPPCDLGIVSLWLAKPLIGPDAVRKAPKAIGRAILKAPAKPKEIPKDKLTEALQITYKAEEAFNYSVIHNSRGGLFVTFDLNKYHEGKVPLVEVCVRLDTGDDRVAECRFFVSMPPEANTYDDLSKRVVLPLGAPLLRQRGEALQATLQTDVTCDGVSLYRDIRSITVLPCDEWRDDESGRHLLPSFVFPRDPAVRGVITAAQPFLRALADQPQAGFDGYQGSFGPDPEAGVRIQVRAIWAALQHPLRLDYVNPPPTYMQASQRLRTPEEIIRARRGTCIELALLIASCLEHVGIFPVIFLTTGHAFFGYWTSEEAQLEFTTNPKKFLKYADKDNELAGQLKTGGGAPAKSKISWVFGQPHHLGAILEDITAGRLAAVEATGVALQRPFEDCVADARNLLFGIRNPREEFDGMLDVQKARLEKVTPLPIITQGPAA